MTGRFLVGVALISALLVELVLSQTACDRSNIGDCYNVNAAGLATCLQQVSDGASRVTNSPVASGTDLDVYISAKWHSKNSEYQACCQILCAQGDYFVLDPLNQTQPRAYILQEKPKLRFSIEPNSGISYGDDNLYTIIMLDLASFAEEQPGTYWAHWVVTDIPGLRMYAGVEQIPYEPLAIEVPYIILLYRQTNSFGQRDILDYVQIGHDNPNFAPFCKEDGRCFFQLAQFSRDLDLELIGTTYLDSLSPVDIYSNYLRSKRFPPLNEASICSGRDGLVANGDGTVTCLLDPSVTYENATSNSYGRRWGRHRYGSMSGNTENCNWGSSNTGNFDSSWRFGHSRWSW